jgi:hypothetical protein
MRSSDKHSYLTAGHYTSKLNVRILPDRVGLTRKNKTASQKVRNN